MDYVKELAAIMNEEGFSVLGKDVSNPEIAEEIYKVHMSLKDPIENCLARIGGLLFIKSDSVSCLENRRDVRDFDRVVELTNDEKSRLRNLKEDIEVLQLARDVICSLPR